jgi:hypothetical protein
MPPTSRCPCGHSTENHRKNGCLGAYEDVGMVDEWGDPFFEPVHRPCDCLRSAKETRQFPKYEKKPPRKKHQRCPHCKFGWVIPE